MTEQLKHSTQGLVTKAQVPDAQSGTWVRSSTAVARGPRCLPSFLANKQ